jgi:hypothetical protein
MKSENLEMCPHCDTFHNEQVILYLFIYSLFNDDVGNS